MCSRLVRELVKGLADKPNKGDRQMNKIKTYTIKERKDGGLWKPLGLVKIHATNWQDAKKQFTQWAMGCLSDENSDRAIEAWDELRLDYNSGKYIDTWHDDVYTYTIKAV